MGDFDKHATTLNHKYCNNNLVLTPTNVPLQLIYSDTQVLDLIDLPVAFWFGSVELGFSVQHMLGLQDAPGGVVARVAVALQAVPAGA